MSRDLVGERAVYTLNADHVLHPAVSDLLGVSEQLVRRLRSELGSWDPAPVAAALYGSAARGDGGDDSDVDLLLIRPSLPTKAARNDWESQIETLRDQVRRWTGNHAQITDRTLAEIRRLVAAGEAIVESWRRDAVTLTGQPLSELLAAR